MGRLDDRPPLLDLRLLEGPKRLWGLLVARRNLLTWIEEAGSHVSMGEGIHDSDFESVDDIPGACPSAPKGMKYKNPANPASSTVRTSGAAATRLLAMTA
jgi:hypothetical protein